MIPILVLKTENKVIYNKSNLNCKTFFEEFIWNIYQHLPLTFDLNLDGLHRYDPQSIIKIPTKLQARR